MQLTVKMLNVINNNSMTPLVCKSFENVNRKQNVCRACVFICLDQLWKLRDGKNKGKQGLGKQRGRCGSRLLPGIVRGTDEGRGRLRKSENITKQVHQWAEAIESIPLATITATSCSLWQISDTNHIWLIKSIALTPSLLTLDFCNRDQANFINRLITFLHILEQEQGFP